MKILSLSGNLLWCLDFIQESSNFISMKILSLSRNLLWCLGLIQKSSILISMKILSLSRNLLWCLDLIRRLLRFFFINVDEDEERWSKKLPDEVMQLILQRLHVSDHFSCRDVCRSWRAAVDCLPSNQHPWLVLGTCHSFHLQDDCFVRDRMVYKSHRSRYKLHHLQGQCIGAIEGWLIMSIKMCFILDIDPTAVDLCLLNPVSGGRVMLPPHPRPSSLSRIKAVASLVPTRRRCYVSCLHLQGEGCVAFCTPADKSWTFIDSEESTFQDIEIVDGKIYVIGSPALEFLMVFDIQLDLNGAKHHTYTRERLVTLHPRVWKLFQSRFYYFRWCYLAKGSGSNDLFMVLHKQVFYKNRGFQVLKLDYNVDTGHRWVEIDDLGDQVLFIGRINNKFMSSGTTSHDQTLERNSIYFVFDWLKRYQTGVFSLTSKSIKPLDFHMDHVHAGLNETLWFTPNPW